LLCKYLIEYSKSPFHIPPLSIHSCPGSKFSLSGEETIVLTHQIRGSWSLSHSLLRLLIHIWKIWVAFQLFTLFLFFFFFNNLGVKRLGTTILVYLIIEFWNDVEILSSLGVRHRVEINTLRISHFFHDFVIRKPWFSNMTRNFVNISFELFLNLDHWWVENQLGLLWIFWFLFLKSLLETVFNLVDPNIFYLSLENDLFELVLDQNVVVKVFFDDGEFLVMRNVIVGIT